MSDFLSRNLRVFGVLIIGVLLVLLSYNSGTVATSSSDPQVMIDCDGSTRIAPEECQPWGEAVLAQGSPVDEFAIADVTRLEIERAFWGYVDDCTASYYLTGSSSPAYEGETDCR